MAHCCSMGKHSTDSHRAQEARCAGTAAAAAAAAAGYASLRRLSTQTRGCPGSNKNNKKYINERFQNKVRATKEATPRSGPRPKNTLFWEKNYPKNYNKSTPKMQ